MATITPGAKLLLHLHHAEIKRPMAYYVLHVGDHETHSQQYDKETHPIFDSKLEFDLTGWWKPKPVAFELFKENRILKDSVCGAFHTTVADLLYIAGLSDDVGPSGIPKIKVTRTPDQPPNIKFWLDVGTGENDSETYTGRVCLSLEIVNTKYIYTPDEECLEAIKLQGPAKMPVVEKKVSEDAAAVAPPPLDGPHSASLKDITAQKATMTAEEAAQALLAAQKAAEPPPVITPETLAQDWWRTLSFDTKFLYAMTLRKKAANQLVKAVERAETIQKIVGDPNTAAPATLVYAHFQAHAIQHPTFQRLNNPEAYTFAMWWFCLGFATILIGTHPIPLVAQYDIITQFCNLLYSGGIVCIGMLFGYAEGFRKLDVAVACLIGITTGMVCDFGSDSVITSAIVIAILGIGNGYPRAQVPLLPEFFSHRPPQYMQPAVLMPQGSQPHLMTQGSQPQLVTQGSHPQLTPQGSQPQLVRPATPVAVVAGAAPAAAAATPAAPATAAAAPLAPQGSQAQLAPQYYIPMPPPDQKVFKLNVTAEQVLAVIKYSMQEAWAGRSTDGVLHYCNRGVAFGTGLLIGVFLMSGLYDMHSLVYCALMAASSAAAPVIMGRKQKIA